MLLNHPALVDLLQQAYSAEKAAAFAYQGHAASLSKPKEKAEVKRIEDDEWNHRREVAAIMKQYQIPVSRYYELKFQIIGKLISWSCYVIGRFMPFYFAGRLESGNVCEYFRMREYFNSLGIYEHDRILEEMGVKEKEHEVYFGEKVATDPLLPFFEKVFGWSAASSFNNLDSSGSVPQTEKYCDNKPGFFVSMVQKFTKS